MGPLAQGLISACFTGELRVQMTGRSAAATYLMGMVASASIGWLARLSWRQAFLVYAVTGVVWVLNFCFLPKIPVQPRPQGEPARFRRGPALILALYMCLVEVAFYAFSTNISLFVTGAGLGDVGAVSRIVSLFMLCGFVSGLLMSRWRQLFRGALPAFGLALMAAGYGLLWGSGSLIPVALGGALIGASYSILYAGIFLQANLCYEHFHQRSFAIALITAGLFLGQFLSPLCLSAAELLLGQGGYRFRFFLLFLALLAAAVVALLRVVRRTTTPQS